MNYIKSLKVNYSLSAVICVILGIVLLVWPGQSTQVVCMVLGIVLGGFIGEMTAKVPGLSWLNFGESFGLNDPLILNLGILVITFGLSIRITMASIIGVIIAILIYHFL